MTDRRPLTPILLMAVGLLLIVGSVFALSGSLPPPIPTPTAVATALTRLIPYPDVPRVELGDAKAAFDLKQAVFIDVRGDPYFSSGHIPGALSITNDEILFRLGELDKNAWIILYCT